jgi:hypothetical protein
LEDDKWAVADPEDVPGAFFAQNSTLAPDGLTWVATLLQVTPAQVKEVTETVVE